TVPGIVDDLTRRGIHSRDLGAWLYRLVATLLCTAHQLVQLPLPLGRLTEHEHPGHVRMVAGYRRTEIDLHEVTADELAVPRAVVRNRRILSCSHDRLESHGLRTMVEHAALQLTSHLTLGAAYPQY